MLFFRDRKVADEVRISSASRSKFLAELMRTSKKGLSKSKSNLAIRGDEDEVHVCSGSGKTLTPTSGGCHMSDQAQKIVGKLAKSKAWIVVTFSILFCALRGCFMCEEGLEKGLAEKIYRKQSI
jgi:hypothetical protein